MKPSDTFHFLANNNITHQTISLSHCYQPIVGPAAIGLYTYLLSLWDNGRAAHQFSDLLNQLDMGMGVLEEQLDLLGAVGLLELYQLEQADYLVKLLPALDRETFLGNGVFRRLLTMKIGDLAVQEMLVALPSQAKNLTKTFSQVFQMDGDIYHRGQKGRVDFDVDAFKQLMRRDGLRFKDEVQDIVGLYHLADQQGLTWFDTYQQAKETAINGQISISRLQVKTVQAETAQSSTGLTNQEQATLKTVRSHSAQDFLKLMKQSRQAVVTDKERQLLTKLAEQGFLDEVINLMVFYTLQRTKSANLNQVFIQKLANDLAYKQIQTAEAALLQLRSQVTSPVKTRQAKQEVKTNVPAWSDQDYKNDTSQEEQERLEAYKRQRLAELERED